MVTAVDPVVEATDSRLGVPWQVMTVRIPLALKIELEVAARQARRTLSAEMRLRLQMNGGGDQLRLVLAAVRARVAHEQIEQLIKFWEDS